MYPVVISLYGEISSETPVPEFSIAIYGAIFIYSVFLHRDFVTNASMEEDEGLEKS